jgi:hypothetical protein
MVPFRKLRLLTALECRKKQKFLYPYTIVGSLLVDLLHVAGRVLPAIGGGTSSQQKLFFFHVIHVYKYDLKKTYSKTILN